MIGVNKFFANLHGRDCQIVDVNDNDNTATVRMTPSSRSGQEQSISDLNTREREYVIIQEFLEKANFPTPQEGMQIIDPEIGTLTITRVDPGNSFGKVAIWRIRAEQ